MTTHHSSRLNALKTFAGSTLGRLLILLVLIAAAFGGNAIALHLKHDKYAAARQAADSFLTAYTHCDLQTAKKYYLAFQTDQTAVSNYQKQCVKGAISFAYDGPGSYHQKTVKMVQTIDVTLIYNASQQGHVASKFLVAMHWSSDRKQWTIIGITAVPANTPSSSASKAS